MSKFYLTDPNINTLPLNDFQFRIYQYCCANYNVKKQQAFIRIVNIGGQFQLTKDEVQEQLIELSKIKHFFEHYKDTEENKWVEVKDFYDKNTALEIYKKATCLNNLTHSK